METRPADPACARPAPEEDFASKYTRPGRVGAHLIDGFFASLSGLVHRAQPRSVLEVGCGEGFSTARIREMLPPDAAFEASDVAPQLVERARARNPGVPVRCESVLQLERPNRAFDLVICLEVLEHLEDPRTALFELCRVAGRAVILSVPREPLWRILNLCRGRYVRALGNTPGHLQHWSRRGFVRFVSQAAHVEVVCTPVPWTQVLARPRLADGTEGPLA